MCKELTLNTEAVLRLEFAEKELHLKPSILKGYQKPGGVQCSQRRIESGISCCQVGQVESL